MRIFFFVLAVLFSSSSFADYQAVRHFNISDGGFGNGPFVHDPVPDYLLICNDYLDWLHLNLTGQPTITYDASTTMMSCKYMRQGFAYIQSQPIQSLKDCSDGLGFRGWDTAPGGSNGNCLGDPPPEPEPCEPGCNGACGQVFSYTNITTIPRSACISDCRYIIKAGVTASGSGGTTSFVEVGNNTGEECTVGAEPPPETPQPSCEECECVKKGMSWGYVNGAPVCVKAGTQGSEPMTVNPPDITTTTTPAPTPENPNPEPFTTTTQQPQITVGGGSGNSSSTGDDNPNVTTTTTDENGATIETTQDKESFCSVNPTHALCQPKTDCDKNPNAVACLEMGDVPDNESLINIERPIQSITLPNLPQSMGCPAPLSISIGGHSITISYQPFCDYAEAFRPLVIAGAWLTAAFIIVGFRGGQD